MVFLSRQPDLKTAINRQILRHEAWEGYIASRQSGLPRAIIHCTPIALRAFLAFILSSS